MLRQPAPLAGLSRNDTDVVPRAVRALTPRWWARRREWALIEGRQAVADLLADRRSV